MRRLAKILGFSLLATSLTVIYLFENSTLTDGAFRIFHWPAIFLTGLGPFGLVLLSSEWIKIKNTWKQLFDGSPSWWESRHREEGRKLYQLSRNYYANGIRAFDKLQTEDFSPPTMRSLDRIKIRLPMQDVIELTQRERHQVEANLNQSIKIVGLGLRLAPSIGMLGTILGMVQLLASLKDPSHIGSHMSLALMTTFYGLFFSLILWTPLQNRLEALLDARIEGFDQLVHWLELLDKRKPVKYFEDNLDQDRFLLRSKKTTEKIKEVTTSSSEGVK